jgi:pre-mRNA-processing factor 39
MIRLKFSLLIKTFPDPVIQPEVKRDVQFPEDRLKAGMKERIVATVVASHEKCEAEVDKRIKFEDKIKRPYFHVKPLDLKQLRNWDAYLDFEMAEGNHERIVVLFERCLIPAANYEQFWVKYARYGHSFTLNKQIETIAH